MKRTNDFGRIVELVGMPLLHSGGLKSSNAGNLGRFSKVKLPARPAKRKRGALL